MSVLGYYLAMAEHPEIPLPKNHKTRIIVIAVVIALLAMAFGLLIYSKVSKSVNYSGQTGHDKKIGIKETDSEAIKAGKKLSGGHCEGEGVNAKLSKPAMRDEDFTMLIPYGLMVGDHVTPIDHQYLSPVDYNSPVNAYEVYAMADGHITSIGTRKNTNQPATEYRMVFTQTCTFQYYYDLVTGLEPKLKAAFEESSKGNSYSGGEFNYEVKAGQLIGYIGGRTLDFAVWDTTKPLKGFVAPEHYDAESWKLYTADPLDYYTDELKAFMLKKYIRTAEPISGKIDYDQDGKLIGNWFKEGTDYGGQIGATQHGPGGHVGHLAITPEHIDPTIFIVSIGDFNGQPKQFAVKGNAPWPGDVTVAAGIVKYELVQLNYVKPGGGHWDRKGFVQGAKAQGGSIVQGVALVQMLEDRKIKFEAFPGKTAAQVSGFTSAAKIYTR